MAYLGIHDNDRRLADHFGGKLHLGFIEIRYTYVTLYITIFGYLNSMQRRLKNSGIIRFKDVKLTLKKADY